jgi:hypothetical protein
MKTSSEVVNGQTGTPHGQLGDLMSLFFTFRRREEQLLDPLAVQILGLVDRTS